MSLLCPLNGDARFASTSTKKSLPINPSIKRISDDEKRALDIRARSTNGGKQLTMLRRRSSFPMKSIRKYSKPCDSLSDIPEDEPSTNQIDREEVRLPVLGEKETNCAFSQGRIDELETMLREKVRRQLSDVRTKFRHASQNGKISRQALIHLIGTIFTTHQQISPKQIDKLLQRIHLQHKDKIRFFHLQNLFFPMFFQLFSFNEFLQCLFDKKENEQFSWKQIFLILKDKVQQR